MGKDTEKGRDRGREGSGGGKSGLEKEQGMGRGRRGLRGERRWQGGFLYSSWKYRTGSFTVSEKKIASLLRIVDMNNTYWNVAIHVFQLTPQRNISIIFRERRPMILA
jgi:hypothetical protein